MPLIDLFQHRPGNGSHRRHWISRTRILRSFRMAPSKTWATTKESITALLTSYASVHSILQCSSSIVSFHLFYNVTVSAICPVSNSLNVRQSLRQGRTHGTDVLELGNISRSSHATRETSESTTLPIRLDIGPSPKTSQVISQLSSLSRNRFLVLSELAFLMFQYKC